MVYLQEIRRRTKNRQCYSLYFFLALCFAMLGTAKSEYGKCEIYNGTICEEFLKGEHVFISHDKSLHKQEKRLKKWFKENQKSRQISKECWEHAKALTCRKFYPECDVLRGEPIVKPLCGPHCTYVKEICRGEYTRTLHSQYYQTYFPLCNEVSLYPGEICWRLTTYDPSKGPVIYAESKKHIRKDAGGQAILKCSFGIKNFLWNDKNRMMIREGTWLRNGKRVLTNEKVSIRTNAKGKARLFMILRINKATSKDAGEYQCEITFANKTIQSGARLTVIESPSRVLTSIENSSTEKCVPYVGSACSPYLQSSLVVERINQPLHKMNAQLENVIHTLKKTRKLSKICEEFGQAVLCYHKFQQCHSETSAPVQSLCKSDCELFHKEYCREELAMVRADRMSMDLFIPKCDILPDNNIGCIRINRPEEDLENVENAIYNEVNEDISCYNEDSKDNYIGTLSMSGHGRLCDKWNKYLGYESIPHDHCRNFKDAKPWCFVENQKEYCNIKTCRNTPATVNTGCYKGRGEEYRGEVRNSKTGKACLQWNKVTPRYSNVDDSFCRNFEEDMDGPWCFVDNKGTKELCDIPKCSAPKKDKSVSLVTYVVPSIIGCSVVLFSLFLLIFYLKNKKLSMGRHSKEEIVDLREEVERGDENDFAKMNTLSTTASYDYKKEQPMTSNTTLPSFHMLNNTPPLEIKAQKRYKRNVPEVKEMSLHNLVKIGDGKLGQLWQGEFYQSRDRITPVLVRKLRSDTRPCVSSDFRQEMNQLKCLKHRNIEQIVCISAMSEIPFMAFDGNHKMDLKEYILGDDSISHDFLMNCIFQIANGLDYLHQQRVLHRDLAARNCFITPDGTVYISKSGLGMYRYPDDYKNLPGFGLSPVRWLSPETLRDGVYRFPTDIYMLGVVIWELLSRAERPYSELCDEDVIQEIMNGNKLQRSVGCPASIWNIMEQCWIMPGCQRPSAYCIKEHVLRLIELSRNV